MINLTYSVVFAFYHIQTRVRGLHDKVVIIVTKQIDKRSKVSTNLISKKKLIAQYYSKPVRRITVFLV